MGFYQLYRLYYCFANEQIHSKKGYPKCLFIIMGIYGVSFGIYVYIILLFAGIDDTSLFVSECGFNDKYEFFSYPTQLFDGRYIFPWSYYGVSKLGIVAWDLLTLFLYVFKIWTFKRYTKNEQNVYKRIMSILHKIFILTIFYEVFSMLYGGIVLFTPIWWCWSIARQLVSLSISVSMYLMMDHNNKQYLKFLKIIYFFRFHWMCCCCRYLVMDQMNSTSETVKIISENNGNNKNPESQFQTNVSVEHQKIELPELSAATKTKE